MRLTIGIVFWLALVFFTGLIARNSVLYFSDPRSHGFVWEKRELADNPVWLAALVIHVAAGIVCLAASFLQFFRPLLRRAPWAHRWLGRIYVSAVLCFLAPTGFYLAFSAHGGAAGTAGFLLLGVLTSVSTWKGWIAMRRRQTAVHMAWMVRSFAMITSAITFRFEHVALQLVGADPETGFLIALYLSIAGNALVAECLLLKIRNRTHRIRTRKKHDHEKNRPVPMFARNS